jgi:hypothetical protein
MLYGVIQLMTFFQHHEQPEGEHAAESAAPSLDRQQCVDGPHRAVLAILG